MIHYYLFVCVNSSTTSSNNQTTNNNSSALSPLRTSLPKPNYISEMNSPLIQVRKRNILPTFFHGFVSCSNLYFARINRKHSLILYLTWSANANYKAWSNGRSIRVVLFKYYYKIELQSYFVCKKIERIAGNNKQTPRIFLFARVLWWPLHHYHWNVQRAKKKL